MATAETKIWMAMKNHVGLLLGRREELDPRFPWNDSLVWNSSSIWNATVYPLKYVINWPLEPFEKPEEDDTLLPYVEIRNLPAGTLWRPISSTGRHQKGGILQVTLLWPAGQVGVEVHPDNLMERAGVIAQAFPTDHKMRYLDVAVRVEQAPDVAQPFRDGVYWRTPISINYSCFTT
jgi:hypothetical protein